MMSDEDLIRRRDAMHIVEGWRVLEDDIEALPAAQTFTAADLKAACRVGFEMAVGACEYVIKNIAILKPDGETYETPRVQIIARGLVSVAREQIGDLEPPADLAARVKAMIKKEEG
jgi:hypothetical protein